MSGCGVEVVIALLHVLAVIAFGTGQPEEPLLEDRVASVPQGDAETEPALAIGKAEQAILAPAIDPAASVVVREVVPAIPVGGVVLAHRAPLTLGEIGAPALPILEPLCVAFETAGFGVGHEGIPIRGNGEMSKGGDWFHCK